MMTISRPTDLPGRAQAASKAFDALAQQSNGDPIPRPLWLNLRLDRWPLAGNGLDLLLLEAERLGKRFDRDRDVLGLNCRSDAVPDLEALELLVDSLCRRFHFSSRPVAEMRLQLGESPTAATRQRLEAAGWQVQVGPPWFEPQPAGPHDVLPLGPAALGCVAGVVFESESNPEDYAAALRAGRLPTAQRFDHREPASPAKSGSTP